MPREPTGPGWWTPERALATALQAIVLAVPIVVVGGAMSPYDDAKAWALQLLAGAGALAWVLAREGRRSRRGGQARSPGSRWLPALVAVYGAWMAVTAGLSITPGQSVSGMFVRGHGLLTLAAALIAFGLVRAACRDREDAISLLDAALLGSLPVCLMALGQAAGWDPLPKPWDPAIEVGRLVVRSTLGQHIFLGGYLVLLVPITACRLAMSLRGWRAADAGARTGGRIRWRWVMAGALWVAGVVAILTLAARLPLLGWTLLPWGVLGAAGWSRAHGPGWERPVAGAITVAALAALLGGQLVVVVASRARGPFIGVVAGLGLTALAILARRRAWKAVGGTVASLTAIALFVAVLNLDGPGAARMKRLPYLDRLGDLGQMTESSPTWVRVQIWRGIVTGWARLVRGEDAVPGSLPRLRSVTGYGLETQLYALDPLVRPFLGVQRGHGIRYAADRAHNDVLDHLATAGLVGASLWLAVAASVIVIGVRRTGASADEADALLRLGCLGAVLGHLVEVQFGVVTPAPLALFWVLAALLTLAPAAPGARLRGERSRPAVRPLRTRQAVAAVATAALALTVGWAATRWLLASVAYADGSQAGLAGDLVTARATFQRARDLAPWIPLSSVALAQVELRLSQESADPASRRAHVDGAASAVATVLRHSSGPAVPWSLVGDVALAQARAGKRETLPEAREAYQAAARQAPTDPSVLARWGLTSLELGDAERARELGRQAVTLGPREWLGWTVVAVAARRLGDADEGSRAADRARALAPAHERPRLDALLR
jgi:hypothetical protein